LSFSLSSLLKQGNHYTLPVMPGHLKALTGNIKQLPCFKSENKEKLKYNYSNEVTFAPIMVKVSILFQGNPILSFL